MNIENMKIISIDDNKTNLLIIESYAKILKLNISSFLNPLEAVEELEKNDYDLIIVDYMMPEMNGIEVIQKVRETNQTIPIIMLTAKGEEIDKITGLTLGADDYVTKPFVPMELMARVRSHLRRYGRYLDATAPKESDSIYLCGGLELNVDTKTVSVDGKKVKVTPIEFKILELLMKNAGKVFSADDIYERVWNEEAINSETVMVHVRNLREKIEINPKKPQYLKVVWGVGYKIDKQ